MMCPSRAVTPYKVSHKHAERLVMPRNSVVQPLHTQKARALDAIEEGASTREIAQEVVA